VRDALGEGGKCYASIRSDWCQKRVRLREGGECWGWVLGPLMFEILGEGGESEGSVSNA